MYSIQKMHKRFIDNHDMDAMTFLKYDTKHDTAHTLSKELPLKL